jgi:hypothetical protein
MNHQQIIDLLVDALKACIEAQAVRTPTGAIVSMAKQPPHVAKALRALMALGVKP